MKLRQLECFKALMVSGTMTETAKLIGTSQPGVSALISALEHNVGFSLFQRQKGRLIATPEAVHFYRIAERIVGDVEDAKRLARQIADGRHGHLTIATLPGLGLTIIPAVIARLRGDSNAARFKILTRSTDAIRTMIPSQQCDVALVEAPVDTFSGLTEIVSFDCVAVLQAENPLAMNSELKPEMLVDEPISSLYSEHTTTQQLEHAFFASQIPWQPVVEARLFATCCEIVKQSNGVAVVDPMTAAQYADHDLVARPFTPRISIDIALTLPGPGPHAKLAHDFINVFKEIAQPYLAHH